MHVLASGGTERLGSLVVVRLVVAEERPDRQLHRIERLGPHTQSGSTWIGVPAGRCATRSRRQPTTSGRKMSSPNTISTPVANHQPPGQRPPGRRPKRRPKATTRSACAAPCSPVAAPFSADVGEVPRTSALEREARGPAQCIHSHAILFSVLPKPLKVALDAAQGAVLTAPLACSGHAYLDGRRATPDRS